MIFEVWPNIWLNFHLWPKALFFTYTQWCCFGTKEHKLKNRPNVLGQDLFEMHSKTEGTSLLWRSIVDFLFEKGISIPRITTKIQTPCNTNFLWMKNSTPFQTIIFDSVFYFISILSFVILFYKVLSQNIWPFLDLCSFVSKQHHWVYFYLRIWRM